MRTKNVQATLDLSDVMRIPYALVKRGSQYLRNGDVLVSTANSWSAVGKACWVPELSEPLAIGGFVTALRRTSDAVDARFLFHWFTSPRTQATLRSFSNATTNISNLNLKLAAQMEVPLPALVEQRRIAAILDKADAFRAKRRQVLAHLEALMQSTFYTMFGENSWQSVTASPPKPCPEGWKWVLLTDVAQLATGHTPDRSRSDYWDGEIPWISLPDIRRLDGCTAHDTELRITEAGIANSSAVLLPTGTVCFSRTASIGFVTKMGRAMTTSQDFHNWVPGPLLHSDYLMAALRLSRFHLLGNSDGSTHKTIYQRVAERFRVLLPPMDLQRKFAGRLERVHVQRDVALRALTAENELFTSLQSRAFLGQL
jgi:type I restriction enzyme S subunit